MKSARAVPAWKAALCMAVLTMAWTNFAQAALVGRDLGGSAEFDAYYDSVLDITWLADANYAKTSGAVPDGYMTHAEALAWTAGLSVHGVGGWRLPSVAPVNGVAYQPEFSLDGSTDFGFALTGQGWGAASELGHLFYVTLGNTGYLDAPSTCDDPCALQHTAPFANFQSHAYWSGSPVPGAYSPSVWILETWSGRQSPIGPDALIHAWAVHDGDVAAIPEPESAALLLVGMAALAGRSFHRKRSAK
jgi:hypothetical protein